MCVVFFFFKQKTAYEMRISDWSSDVCSSDLRSPERPAGHTVRPQLDGWCNQYHHQVARADFRGVDARELRELRRYEAARLHQRAAFRFARGEPVGRPQPDGRLLQGHDKQSGDAARSEEHTSELQSLMRNSYAVFCLK